MRDKRFPVSTLVLCLCSTCAADNSSFLEADGATPIPEATTRIATSLNISLCLGHVEGIHSTSSLMLVNCLDDAAAWAWPPRNALLEGPLRTGGVSGQCLNEELSLAPCQVSTEKLMSPDAVWTWDQNTSQIHFGPDSPAGRCLSLSASSQFELADCAMEGDARKAGQTWILEILPTAGNVFECRDVDCLKTWVLAQSTWLKAEILKMNIYQQAGVALVSLSLLLCCLGCLKSCCCAKARPAPLPPPPPKEARSMFDCSGPSRQPRNCFCCARSPVPNGAAAYKGLLSNDK